MYYHLLIYDMYAIMGTNDTQSESKRMAMRFVEVSLDKKSRLEA